jgi:hypothetical protein
MTHCRSQNDSGQYFFRLGTRRYRNIRAANFPRRMFDHSPDCVAEEISACLSSSWSYLTRNLTDLSAALIARAAQLDRPFPVIRSDHSALARRYLQA